MENPYPIIEVTDDMRRDSEPLGSKPKFWFKYQDKNWLFKEARENTGEDWAEKIASEVAGLMGLPSHHAELAIWNGRPGCAVQSFLKSRNQGLVHGNELLGGLLKNYDKEKVHGQSDHTFENIVQAFEALFPDERSRNNAPSRMVGYLVLDALVGNTDRHHQNWGVILTPEHNLDGITKFSMSLAPTFDHASSLGRELLDEARERRLKENSVLRYIRKGHGAIFENFESKRGLSPIRLVELVAERFPELFSPWQKRVTEIEIDDIQDIVSRVPDTRMSEPARNFALSFMSISRNLIRDL